MGFCNSFGQILRDFSGWTSAHGIPHIGSAQNIILRLFWTIVFILCVGMFTWQMTTLVEKYQRFEVTVQTALKFEERKFPAVTVCPLNPWKKDAVAKTKLGELTNQYNNALRNPQVAKTEIEKWGFLDVKEEEIQQRALVWSAWLGSTMALEGEAVPQLDENNYTTYAYDEAYAYTYDDFILNCAYNTKGCNSSDFNKIYLPHYGFCYTFNYKAQHSSTRAGPLYGMRLLMKADQGRYMDMTPEAGAAVMIHDHGEAPHVDAYGYRASCGDATSIGARFVQTVREPYPYGNCIDMSSSKSSNDYIHHYNGTYTVEGCFRSCVQEKVLTTCGCYNPVYAKPTDTSKPNCADGTIEQIRQKMDCVLNLMSDLNQTAASGGFNVIADCSCPQPCEESTYSVTVSTALWPSDVYRPADCTSKKSKHKDEETCIKWYHFNTLLIEVFFERMNYQVMQESPAYTDVSSLSLRQKSTEDNVTVYTSSSRTTEDMLFILPFCPHKCPRGHSLVNLVSDMGGQLGLWMGISIVTAVEFLALIILLCVFCVKRANLNDEEEDDDEEVKPKPESRPKSQLTNVEESIYDGSDDMGSVEPPPVKY